MKTFAKTLACATGLFAHASAQDEGPVDCSAEIQACLAATAPSIWTRRHSSPQDMDTAALIATAEGSALMICSMGDQPCATETVTCMGVTECAAIMMQGDDEMDMDACMANTECAATWNCQIAQHPCNTEMQACQADTDCAAAFTAQDVDAA